MTRVAHHTLIIIGAGPAGLTAGIYSARAELKPLIISGPVPGGQLMGTTVVENWPGNISIMGPQLMMNMREHAERMGATFSEETIQSIDVTTRPFRLTTGSNTVLTADALIIATGATPKRLGCPGEDTYWGKGVTTCAVCDGALYRDKKVIVVGGGDTAMEDASFMTKFTKDITVVHIRDKLSASVPMQQRVLNNPTITIRYEATITEIHGDGTKVTGVTLTDQKTKETSKLAIDAVFIAVGLAPNSAIVQGKVDCDQRGYIIVPGETTETSVQGIFAAGDVVDPRYRQAIASAGEGCKAAMDAERFISHPTPLLRNFPLPPSPNP